MFGIRSNRNGNRHKKLSRILDARTLKTKVEYLKEQQEEKEWEKKHTLLDSVADSFFICIKIFLQKTGGLSDE
jgi:hypothetical protein